MSKKHQTSHLNNENMDDLSAPPGFVSLTSFILKRVGKIEEANNSKEFLDSSTQKPTYLDSMSGVNDNAMLKKTLRQIPRIIIDPANHNSEVTARWRPVDAIANVLEEAPVFHPTGEEFKDIVQYIAKIRSTVEAYGMCRIVPPSSWKHPENKICENNMFVTHIQRIDGVKTPYLENKISSPVEGQKHKRKRSLKMGLEVVNGHATYLGEVALKPGPEFTFKTFKKYADDFKGQYFCKSKVRNSDVCSTAFQKQWEPSVENIEGEYNRIVVNPTEEIEVLCGDNLDPNVFGGEYPAVTDPLDASGYPENVNSGWNLNNLPRLPGSLLSFESHYTCPILMPRARIGMCFSSLHWVRFEDYFYVGINCLFLDSCPCLPSCIAWIIKFEETMKNFVANISEPELRYRLAKQFSPSILKSEGIPVFRCVQNPGEFVLVLPGAYHSGFDCGFNHSEAAKFAPLDWLPHGQLAVENYQMLERKTSISHDKLLLGAAQEAVRAQWELSLLCRKNTLDNLRWKDACGKEGILTKAFKSRVKSESLRREYLCSSSQLMKMDLSFDATIKRECCICFFDLHMAAAGCPCSSDRYSCLNHAKQLCSCAWTEKFFLFRYEISDLNILVEALEGKLSCVYKWAKEYLGLAVSSHVSKNSLQPTRNTVNPTSREDKSEKEVYGFEHTARPKSSRSVSQYKAEIKARLLKTTISKKAKDNAKESAAAATCSAIGRSSTSGFREEMKARIPQLPILNDLKAKVNTVEPKDISSTAKGKSVLPMELISEVSASSSETSSSESED
ncbi:hypothetical protein FEM48_Zijuj09G0058500 [Ziziphus jujuba var. spinosa]|uniref:Lysine-specific demethylase JMJ16 n=1 Tax=Ziziphus jujuba var. spinosa TaxID=714518 RepID=A0A978UR90_ZIZJJ|nr:hypothetical protein FEM48_Zijuj09G0058500 [Ziziphus jujuba var. spinosa]